MWLISTQGQAAKNAITNKLGSYSKKSMVIIHVQNVNADFQHDWKEMF